MHLEYPKGNSITLQPADFHSSPLPHLYIFSPMRLLHLFPHHSFDTDPVKRDLSDNHPVHPTIPHHRCYSQERLPQTTTCCLPSSDSPHAANRADAGTCCFHRHHGRNHKQDWGSDTGHHSNAVAASQMRATFTTNAARLVRALMLTQ